MLVLCPVDVMFIIFYFKISPICFSINSVLIIISVEL